MSAIIHQPQESLVPTPWAVRCRESCYRRIYLIEEEYIFQLDHPNAHWRCPRCLIRADWDDDNYEWYMEIGEAIYYGTWLVKS